MVAFKSRGVEAGEIDDRGRSAVTATAARRWCWRCWCMIDCRELRGFLKFQDVVGGGREHSY